MNDKLVICLDDIPEDGCHIEGDLDPSIMQLGDDSLAKCEEPVQYSLNVTVVSGEFLVHGKLWTEACVRCCRCSEFFPVAVSESAYNFDLEASEITESVDLTEDIREAIILTFPSYPVCRTECKGLCPQCGANKNEGECQCKPPADDRWAALDGLD